MARKIRNLWQKLLSFALGLLGVTNFVSCNMDDRTSSAGMYGMEEPIYNDPMYGMVDMYGMPDPLPGTYYKEGIYGKILKGSTDEEGKIEAEEFSSPLFSKFLDTDSEGLSGVTVLILENTDYSVVEETQVSETGEFSFSRNKVGGKDVTFVFCLKDENQKEIYKTLIHECAIIDAVTLLKVTMQPVSENDDSGNDN